MSSGIKLKGMDSRLDDILKDTYYQIVYQEQVTEIAEKLAGYTQGQADVVRKAIGRKDAELVDKTIAEIRPRFIEHGMSVECANALCEVIKNCGSYIFNKSHSVEYGLISYQTAYLKANYPVEYMCSLLNACIDTQEDVIPYLNECKRMGISILPPNVQVGNLRFEPEQGNIRIGLLYVKGIGNLSIKYCDNFSDFLQTNGYDKRVKEALIKSGAADCFGLSRNDMMAIAFNIDREIEIEKNKISKAQQKIADKTLEIANSKQGTKKVAQLYKQIENQKKAIEKSNSHITDLVNSKSQGFDEVQGEIDTLGFTLKDRFADYHPEDFSIYSPNSTIRQKIICVVENVKKIKDKNGNLMAFITVEPYKSEKQDIVMFASCYRELSTGTVYVMEIKNKTIFVDCMKAKK